ncbi:MAG TPA: hypothetical protein VFY31_07185 [Macromonas sp.]|nr:hypothetical protein [Macromonas sp.]
MNTGPQLSDTRPRQAIRVADYLEQRPGSTQKEIDAVCDTGCISKVLSDMPALGYGLSRAWREIPCDSGRTTRQVRTYTLLYRPARNPQPDLFPTE